MRRSLLLAGLLLLGAPAHAAANRCDVSAARGPAGLPQTIYVKGACGTLALRPDGEVEQVRPRPWAPNWAKKALARADDRTYIVHPHRHLVLLRDGKTFWRSHLAHGSDEVVLHGDAIAFTAFERPQPDIWVARVGQAERLAARGEDLYGWARSGGFFTRRGNELLVRGTDGRLLRRVGVFAGATYDRNTQTIVAIASRQLLVRTDGRRTIVLATLGKLGAARDAWVEVLPSGLIRISAANRLLLYESDGRPFASAAGVDTWSSVLTLPRQRGVVFVGQRHNLDRVVLLRRGRRAGRILYETPTGPRGCGYWANLSQAGDGFLYWPSTGHALVLIDTSGRAVARNLWPDVQRLPGFRHHGRVFRAGWATAWNS